MGKLDKKKPGMKKSGNLKKQSAVNKAKQGGTGGKVASASKAILKPSNPFEVKINKQKFQLLGRPTKHETGLPGVSRARALKKRHQTLLLEYKNRFKSNKMIDRRLGEKDPTLSVESKMEMRFMAQKIKSQNKVLHLHHLIFFCQVVFIYLSHDDDVEIKISTG